MANPTTEIKINYTDALNALSASLNALVAVKRYTEITDDKAMERVNTAIEVCTVRIEALMRAWMDIELTHEAYDADGNRIDTRQTGK